MGSSGKAATCTQASNMEEQRYLELRRYRVGLPLEGRRVKPALVLAEPLPVLRFSDHLVHGL